MNILSSSVQKALKADRISPRPHGSTGAWVSFLLPVAVILSSWTSQNVTEFYISCAIYSFNTLLNALHLLFHIFNYKSINVTKGFNILCVAPLSISVYLYIHILDLDIRRSLCHAVANALIYFEGIPFLFKVFPKTFTFGEANIVIQGLSLFLYSLFLRLNYIILNGVPKIETDVASTIIQLALSWILLFCIVLYTISHLRTVVMLYVWGLSTLGLIYYSVNYVLNRDLFEWLWIFLTKPERNGIIILWFMCSATAVFVVHHQISKNTSSGTILRKYFHALAVVVFLSGILLDVDLIYFSSACVFGLFIVLEAFRISKLPPFYQFLQRGFAVYSDEKDSGVLALTPICLLVGCALPIWLCPSRIYSSRVLMLHLSGVLSVGIGDTFASIGGKLFGKHRWKGSSKTIEGTIFCILSQVLFLQVLTSLGFLENSTSFLIKSTTAIFITSIVESKTDQIDNIVLPLIMYIILMVLGI